MSESIALSQALVNLADINIFEEGRNPEFFVGKPYGLDYNSAHILVADAWKDKVKGIPQGAFLLAFYDGESGVDEAVLLRALRPSKLPTDMDMVSSMIEYYKEGTPISGRSGASDDSKLDDFTRYEFSFSGLECRVLGTFYNIKDEEGKITRTEFGADLENFYSANNYSVYKVTGRALFKIVNQREGSNIAGGPNEAVIGKVRFSSSRRFQDLEEPVKVYVSPKDFIGKRTALFGMTRTGKSNTVKKIIEATEKTSFNSPFQIGFGAKSELPFTEDGRPSLPVGQIIFDVNGEYANSNLQDEGTAIFDLYQDKTIRYSTIPKDGFEMLKVNFYSEIISGLELIKDYLKSDTSDYIKSFRTIDLNIPDNYAVPADKKSSEERNAAILYDKKLALYKCCLFKAGFSTSVNNQKVKFFGCSKSINDICSTIKPHDRISLQEATTWFETMFDNLEDRKDLFDKYKEDKKTDYFDEDMLAMLKMLTRKSKPKSEPTYTGFRKLQPLNDLHTSSTDSSFETNIINYLREGKIVIIDLSQGNPEIQELYSEKISRAIFQDAMGKFVKSTPNNFIQFYFEEAHNLFPKKDDKNLSQIYNRIAKEGAKLNLGMIYATQEVSSISSNILKNTQNWFIAHLNNDDEMKELRKYYDFSDFTDALLKFSSSNDKGFIRMKTYTNPFVVPVQIDKFLADRNLG